ALSSRYLRVLEWLSCGGVGGFGAVPLVAPSERAWLLDEVNDRARDYGPFVPVHGAFEALARAEPERPAVRFEGMEIGYGELNTRANGLAHRLRRAGVGRDVRVGVALERSVELVVALLAVVKAGGAYVPLDPELPADRLSFMISDADAAVVVTRTGLLETLPLHDGRTICIDDGARSGRRGLASDDLEIALEPDDLAYVIYTSGSTGRPKGVMNSHGGLRNRLMWMQDAFPIGAEDRVLQKTPYTFDVSVWEFFWPLMRGATIVVAKPEGHRDPDYLAGLLHDEGVTVLHFVPSMLQAFLGHEPSAALLGDCWALRYVICSGEALSPGLADRFHGFAPDGASLHNLYGPTEAAIDVTHWPCCDPSADPLPIGHGIANTRLYVLDSAHEPVPVGVAGDLWIGGVQVARGYVRRPGLTAESFIADPHGPVPGGRMYRTGDLARRRADGALEYLGRRDFQVKLRGFRIELGEIESVLLNHGGIRSGAVLLREDRAGDPRLVGYIVPEGGVLPGDLEAYLRDRLADYMVPSDWVVLDALPVTANGKLDRGALPAPDLRTGVGSGRPRGPEEEVCCAVFASVLGRENVGVEDNFFALGGHSLLAVQVVGRLRRALQVELPANAVFAHASPRLLAAHIQNARHLKTTPINKRKPGDKRRATSAEASLWLVQQQDPDNVAYNMTGAIDIDGLLDAPAMTRALMAVNLRHPALHSLFIEQPDGLILEPRADLIQCPAIDEADSETDFKTWISEIERVETARPFRLDKELPFRARILRLADNRHRVLIAFHHIAADAYAIDIFSRDLEESYRRALENPGLEPAELSEQLAPPGFDPLAAEERLDFTEDGAAAAALRRWALRLKGVGAALSLPREEDQIHDAALDGTLGVETLFIDEDLRRRLADRARAAAVTPFVLLHATLAVALHRFGGGEDVVIGTPVSQRPDEAFARSVAMMLNTVPLRLAIEPDARLSDIVAGAQDCLIDVLADSVVPLDRIVEAVNADRSGVGGGGGDASLFQVLLTTHPPHLGTLQLGDANVAVRVLPQAQAKMDLVVLCADAGATMNITIEHAAGLFPDGGAARFAQAFLGVLDAVASSPSTPVDHVLLFGPGSSEYSDEVSGSAVVDARGAPGGTILDRFSEIAARHGDLVALEGPDGSGLDYGALDRLTDRLAGALAAAGVGRGDLVGVNMARGVEQIVVFLSILKAGGAYVPLDREQPGPRLAGMVADGGIGFVVRDEAPTGGEWLGEDIKVLSYGALAASDLEDAVRDTAKIGADTAYVMFTSGSSGRPKGVQVPHRAVLRLAVEPGFASFGPGKRVAQIATTSFDAATYEIWCALLNGATCVVVEREAAYDGASLASAFQGASGRVGVHSTFLTVSVFNRAVFAEADAFSGFEEVMFGGEAADAAAVRAAVARWPEVRFINGYGPTETTTFAAHHGVVELLPTAARVPIGHPIRGTALYILDRHLSPVPRGVAGELWIGGIGLADGYVGRPGQTASVFAADPFSPEPGSRMYRSGDLARRRPDGAVDYLGRVDRQLKLRGFRIEPGEVEAALRAVAG
ncbi:MAG: amino acid adenylation domain-containing protein, partial [Rhodospirillaceae bacterium]|nr:amino acid adenylation domain-containing protein [Rhodospirillaceae bacterium]